jgi:hypothetical protein
MKTAMFAALFSLLPIRKTGFARRANNFTFSEVIGWTPNLQFRRTKTSFFISLPPSITHFSG